MASYNRCWISEKWVCNENPIGEIFEDAYYKFSDGWEYWKDGTGGNADGDELKDTDCWYLVTDTLNGLGYHSAPRNRLSRWKEYFCEVPLKDAAQGDIMAWDLFGVVAIHVEILESKNPITVYDENCWQVNGWGAQDYPKSVDPNGAGPDPDGIGESKNVVGADGKTGIPGTPYIITEVGILDR
ncbi:hypothetical protein [Desulfomonile tiedjei]|uniref:Uncharacterized protein n=1 Tax=Desulfomonile tiedjei (strain ATCC 49306 / DSM 6799 / DCB-1) TaxID=706587 RepID=I4C993_DESTA|nr:hypothetical protein [Desulfomonile tiedjei]AFM26134.1 hypothetical protein Desti_3483 [Desulfomonile tiedjei DSM 6799]